MKQAVIIQPLIENNRIQLGISYIERALKDVGYEISGVTEEPGNDYRELEGIKIYVGNREESAYLKDLEDRGLLIYHKEIPAEEGFYLNVTAPKLCIVSGGDATGGALRMSGTGRAYPQRGQDSGSTGISGCAGLPVKRTGHRTSENKTGAAASDV